jgi:5-methyltetrahydrofolate--homocysteine methyltransferase
MAKSRFLERLAAGEILVCDGATGTNLQKRGLPVGSPSDMWVLENPQGVKQLHQDFVNAGSNLILTNTFGSSQINLKKVGLSERMAEMNRKAVALAKEVVQGTDVFVAGSLGPTGEMLKPYGTLSVEEAEASYAAQAKTLTEEGVDLLVIETQFDLEEAKAGIRGVRSVSDLPLICSFSFDRGKRTMMGVKPAQLGEILSDMGVSLLGINCGKSLEENLDNLKALKAATDLPIWFKPNAGLPKTDENGNLYYDVTPEIMGSRVPEWVAAGARIVGGCCGTSPEHVKAIAEGVRNL